MGIFALTDETAVDEHICQIWRAIQQNEGYFKKFNGAQWEEAQHLALNEALSNYDPKYPDIAPYIKKLARTISRNTNNRETSHSVTNDDGEVSVYFKDLTTSFEIGGDEFKPKLLADLMDLYLEFPEDMMLIKTLLYKGNATKSLSQKHEKEIRNERPKNAKISHTLSVYATKMSSVLIHSTLMEFYKELDSLLKPQEKVEGIKELTLAEADYSCASKIDTEEEICILSGAHSGKRIYLDPRTLCMTGAIDLDFINKWVPLKQKCDVVRIDISALTNYLEQHVLSATQGINTALVSWLGTRYKLTTPGGHVELNMDLEKFYDLCKQELLLNLLAANFNQIIGVGCDSIFIRPTRRLSYNLIKCRLFNDKILEFPVTLHFTTRK